MVLKLSHKKTTDIISWNIVGTVCKNQGYILPVEDHFFLTPYFFLCILKHLSISLWSQKIIKNRFLSKNRTGVRICVFSTILYLSKVCRCLLVWVFICGFQQLDVIANQNIGRSIWWAQHRCFMCDSSSINQYLWGTLQRNLLHVCIFVRITGINLVLTLSLAFRRWCLCTSVLSNLSTQFPVQELYISHNLSAMRKRWAPLPLYPPGITVPT